MLEFAINNETTEVGRPLPFLIKNHIYKGDTAMTNKPIPYPTKNGNSPEYRVWCAMKRRCNNLNVIGYENYGGRGISVCSRWSDSFEAFFEDMGPRPSKSHSIERLENDGDYEPSNCKWATREEQANNRRDSVKIESDGVVKTQTEWAQEFGMGNSTVKMRILRGMIPEEAIKTPGHIYRARPFNVYDKNTGSFVGQWRMKMDCARDLGIDDRHIGSVLNGNRISTNGYTMKYQEGTT